MDTRTLLQIMATAENLKNNTRHSWTSAGRHESVAEHSWRLTMLAFFVKDEFPEADIDKVIRMCIFHDIGEAFTGDVPAFEKTDIDEEAESREIYDWLDSLPAPYRAELIDLFREMDALETREAKIYKALDNMEAIIQHNEADISTWIPLEYTANLEYGTDKVAFSDYMKKLKQTIYEDSVRKIEDERRGRAGK